ncbi:MAG: hypothetical protein LBG93_03795 [Treponema sp.]|jgi:hypothetical protein|nr:hypothetical protein [Treponema sp.]
MSYQIITLNLLNPLFYASCSVCEPFDYREENGEVLFHFSLDKARANDFEPDKSRYLPPPVFSGCVVTEAQTETEKEADKQAEGKPLGELPGGYYLFAQKREIMSESDIVDMAIDIQQEGLWQRLTLGRELYLRYLFEDGKSVTQLFRQIVES